MKLLRYGPRGTEKPGLVDADGNIRSLEGQVDDLAGEALSDSSLDRLRRLVARNIPRVVA